jgi:hypothetical protein
MFVPSPSSMRSVAMPSVDVGMSEFKTSDFEFFLGAAMRFCHRFELSDSEDVSKKCSDDVSSWGQCLDFESIFVEKLVNFCSQCPTSHLVLKKNAVFAEISM